MSNRIAPTAWACRKCGKVDWNDTKESLAKPEHISHRGFDIGSCPGEIIKLYTIEQLEKIRDQ